MIFAMFTTEDARNLLRDADFDEETVSLPLSSGTAEIDAECITLAGTGKYLPETIVEARRFTLRWLGIGDER